MIKFSSLALALLGIICFSHHSYAYHKSNIKEVSLDSPIVKDDLEEIEENREQLLIRLENIHQYFDDEDDRKYAAKAIKKILKISPEDIYRASIIRREAYRKMRFSHKMKKYQAGDDNPFVTDPLLSAFNGTGLKEVGRILGYYPDLSPQDLQVIDQPDQPHKPD